jgi:hypothetical protein
MKYLWYWRRTTKFLVGASPGPILTKASFKIGRISPAGVCRLNRVGSPPVLADLSMVMDAPISMVTGHAFLLSFLRPVECHGRVFWHGECVSRTHDRWNRCLLRFFYSILQFRSIFFCGMFLGLSQSAVPPKIAGVPTLPADVSFRPAIFVPCYTWYPSLFGPI